MQSDWIGRSYGAEVDFKVDGTDKSITVYTTRPDTLHGATFMVLAPEHAMARELATEETKQAVEDYIYRASTRSNIDRMADKEKDVYKRQIHRLFVPDKEGKENGR